MYNSAGRDNALFLLQIPHIFTLKSKILTIKQLEKKYLDLMLTNFSQP